MEHVAARFTAFYPPDLQQPLFFPDGEDTLEIRLPRIPDAIHRRPGHINLRDLSVVFHICTYWPEDDDRWAESTYETHEFGLETQEGWEEMLRDFPQALRAELPQADVMHDLMQDHLGENPGEQPGLKGPGIPPSGIGAA